MEKEKTDFDICKEIERILKDNQINILEENGIRIYMYNIFMNKIKSTDGYYTYNDIKQMFNKCMELYFKNDYDIIGDIQNIVDLVINYWEYIKDMSMEKISGYLEKRNFQDIITDKRTEYIDKMLSQTLKEFDRLKKGIGTIDVATDDKNWITDIQEMFVINEFIAFLKNEIERVKTKGEYKLEPLVPLKDYETIMNEEGIGITDSILQFFWNTECGVNYGDFAEMVKELAEDIRETNYYEKMQQQ